MHIYIPEYTTSVQSAFKNAGLTDYIAKSFETKNLKYWRKI